MFTDWLRKVFGGLLDKIGLTLVRWGISANAITIVGCALNIGIAAVLATGRLRLGGVLLIFASVFDAFDGSVARHAGAPTKYGAFLDSVLDRVSESAVLLGIAIWYMQQPGLTEEILAYVAICGSLMVSYTRSRAEGLNIPCKVGLLTRVERCILIIAALILGLTVPALWILAIGTPLTALHRALHVYQQSKGQTLQGH